MEPIKPSAPPPQSAPASAPPRNSVQIKSGRFRQLVGYVGGASLGFVMLVGVGEIVLKPGLRPSDLLANVEAHVELGIMNGRLGRDPSEHVLNEAQYRAVIAQAERSGAAKAEIAYQRQLAQVQADRERVVQAYTSLYQRANMIAQAAIQLETLAQEFRQRLIEATNGGRSVVIGIKDLFCGLGSPEACESAHEDRRSMIAESDELSRGDVGARVRELMSGVEDPVIFVVREDQRRNGVPALPKH